METLKLFKTFIFESKNKISIVQSPIIVDKFIFVISTNGNLIFFILLFIFFINYLIKLFSKENCFDLIHRLYFQIKFIINIMN